MDYSNTRVLVAEDDPLIRMFIVEVLEDAGLKVFEAEDGIIALKLIEHPDHIDLLVTDINMPGLDGIAVAHGARANHPTIPVLFVSARPEQLAAMHAPKPYRYLVKPFDIAELHSAIESLIEPTAKQVQSE